MRVVEFLSLAQGSFEILIIDAEFDMSIRGTTAIVCPDQLPLWIHCFGWYALKWFLLRRPSDSQKVVVLLVAVQEHRVFLPCLLVKYNCAVRISAQQPRVPESTGFRGDSERRRKRVGCWVVR
jgi:hypothetical protein